MSRMALIGVLAAVACSLLIAARAAPWALAGRDAGLTTQPTSTPTPPISSAPTKTPVRTSTPGRTPPPRTHTPPPAATPPSSAPSPTAPAVATLPPPPPPVAVPSATNTPLSVAIPSPEPTDLPVGVPAATSTAPSFSAGAVPDLVATAIEVTQGMQNMANDMPLVEDRLTVARVYVKTQDPDVPAANIKGVLAAFRDGQLLGIEYPENGPISAVPDGGLRTNIDDSLYFYLPGAWTAGSILLRTFVYSTTPDAPYEQEPDETNNFADVSVQFQAGDPLKLRLAPLHLHAQSNAANADITYHYGDHQSDALEIIVHLLRFHPLGTDNFWFDASSILVLEDVVGPVDIAVTSIKPVGHKDGVEWNLSLSDDRGLANSQIALFKSMAPEEYQGWRWYGMVDPAVSMGGYIGWANNGGTHGLMDNTTTPAAIWDNIGGYALAHEIAHLFLSKPEHVNCTGGESGPDPAYPYPSPNCQLAAIDPEGYYGFDTYWQLWGLPGPAVISNDPGAPANQFAFPMMGAKSPWWIDPFYYCRLLDAYGVACDPLALNVAGEGGLPPAHAHGLDPAGTGRVRSFDTPPRLVRANADDGYIYVSARIDAIADTAAFVDVMRMIDPAAGAADASRAALEEGAASEYSLEFDDLAGSVLASYPVPEPEPGAHDAPPGNPMFNSIVGYPEGTAFVRLRHGDRVLAERSVSANAPLVRVLSPNGGERVIGAMDVRWEASDADGDALRFTVMYSTDSGATWAPVATDLRGSAITLPSLDGIAGSEQALIRVLASDGVLTGYDDSDAPFSVPDSAPHAFIAASAGGSTFPQGATVVLVGGAYDLEDGALTGDSLRWTSSIDGDLGAGTQVSTRALSRGTHEITLTARDSGNSAPERTVTITIGDPRPGQPDQDERDQAADFLLNGRGDDAGAPWLIIGIVAGAATAAALAAGAFAAMRLRQRAG